MKTMQFSLSLLLVLIGYASKSQVFTIDNGHTAITSKVMRFDVVRVVGRFNTVSGTVQYNHVDPAKTSASITVQSNSYTANNPDGENAVKGNSFLDVKAYPEILFVTKSLAKTNGGYIVTANLTLHGITKEVTFPIVIYGPSLDLASQKQSIGITGILTISRLEFGIGTGAKMPSGVMVIGDDVEIGINALAIAR